MPEKVAEAWLLHVWPRLLGESLLAALLELKKSMTIKQQNEGGWVSIQPQKKKTTTKLKQGHIPGGVVVHVGSGDLKLDLEVVKHDEHLRA